MKTILIIDPLSPFGHVNYNYGILKAISHYYSYKLIVNQNMANQLSKKGVDSGSFLYVFPDSWSIASLSTHLPKTLYHILSRFYLIRVLLYSRRESKKYDFVLFTSVDVYSFMFLSYLWGRNCFVVDHGIGFVSDHSFYRMAWRLVNGRVSLIVLEDYIKLMVEVVLKKNNVFVLRHPLPAIHSDINTQGDHSGCFLFAPSNSNDDSFVKDLMQSEIPPGFRIVIKSSLIDYHTSDFIIYKNRLSPDKYHDYMSTADYIMLPYPSSYNYRISAVLFEALQLGKPVLLRVNNTLSHYKELFPKSVFLFNTVDDLWKVKAYAPSVEESSLALYTEEALASTVLSIFN